MRGPGPELARIAPDAMSACPDRATRDDQHQLTGNSYPSDLANQQPAFARRRLMMPYDHP